MKRAKQHSKRGISLVEVIVALLIFSISVAGICRLISMGRQGSDRARAHYTAINLAKNRLERIKTYDFDQIELFGESNVKIDHNGGADPDGDYRRSTAVTVVTNDLKEVAVTVEVRDKISRTFDGEEETVRTYIADYLMYGEE